MPTELQAGTDRGLSRLRLLPLLLLPELARRFLAVRVNLNIKCIEKEQAQRNNTAATATTPHLACSNLFALLLNRGLNKSETEL